MPNETVATFSQGGFQLGNFALILAVFLSLWGLIAGAYSALANNARAETSSRTALQLMNLCTLLALILLAKDFLSHNYQLIYVWQNSNNAMPWYYRISAIWGGMDGSLLLWAAMMTLLSGIVTAQLKGLSLKLRRWVVSVLSLACSFFLLIVAFFTNPFRLHPAIVQDGNGLNPLLQNPSMLIHPPLLYLGFTGFVVPFAFCLGALLSGDLSGSWIRHTRRWTLLAWSFLSAGIVLGGNWAYIELGWGGFWAWDPVENASFFPWLTGTAFLHSVMVQERRGMLKVWNVLLSVLTYLLAVFGTFLTRSGIVQSVHAFAATEIGWVFLLYIGVLAAISLGLIIWRLPLLKSENKLESYLSREAAFLFNNLALLAICFATLWGVLYPVISEALGEEKAVVGPPFFNKVNVPLFLFLIFLMGVGPLISWRKTTLKNIWKTFSTPFLTGALLTAGFLVYEPSRPTPAIAFGLSLFVIMSIESEFRRAARARQQFAGSSYGAAAYKLIKTRPQRWGGYIVHLGVCIMTIAITASMAYKVEREITLKPGQSAEVGSFKITLDSLEEKNFENYLALISQVTLSDKSGRKLKVLKPERRLYFSTQEVTTEVDIRTSPGSDFYLALAGSDMAGIDPAPNVDVATLPAIFKVFINPLQVWLWFGALVMLGGSLLILLPFSALANVKNKLVDPATAESEAKV